MKKSEVLLSLPSIFFLVVFFLIPFLIVVLFSFKPSDVYGGLKEGWTLSTYLQVLSPSYLQVIGRTFGLSFATTFISLCLAIPVGYYLATTSSVKRKIILLAIVVPSWTSFLIRIYAWRSLLHPEGFIKNILLYLQCIDPGTTLLYHNWTVVVVMVYAYLPFGIFPIYAASSKFRWETIEAAFDLGASRFQAFYKIFLPGIQKGITTAFIMIFIPAIGAYVIPDLVGGTGTEMIGNKIVQKTLVERNLPVASALTILLALLIIFPICLLSFGNRINWSVKTPPKGVE